MTALQSVSRNSDPFFMRGAFNTRCLKPLISNAVKVICCVTNCVSVPRLRLSQSPDLTLYNVSGELEGYLSHCSEFSVSGVSPVTRSQSPAPSLTSQSSDRAIMNHETLSSTHFQAEKRKMEPELGDTVGHNNPSKIPKMEPKLEPGMLQPKLEPGSPGLNQMRMGSESLNMLGMSGGSVKVEPKSEAEDPGELATGKMPGFSGSGSLNKSNPDDNFLLAGSVSLTTEQPQQTPVDQKDKQQKTNTAAKIRTALEASGLAGNLTPDDLQTLKRLNEIAKSTGLSQEQKSLEASTLLKNNPNVSRLLLKLRTGKNLNQPPKEGGGMVGPMAGGQGYPGPVQVPGPPHNGQFPGPQSLSGLTGPGGRASPASGHYNTNYGQHQPGPGQNNNNYYSGHTGHSGHHPPAGQWNGGPAPGSPGYYRPEMTGHMAQRMHPDMVPSNFPGMAARAGPGGNMYGMGMMERMHGMGPAPRTMYMNRQTGMLMQPEYPASGGPPGQTMMGPRPGFHGSVPPPYMSPGHTGYHPGPGRQQMMAQRMPVTPMMSHPGHHPGPGHYEMSPGQRANSGMYPEYGDNFAPGGQQIPGNNFNTGPEFRENMLSSKFQTGSDFNTRSVPSQMQGPGHQPGVSQLRARLSQPGPASGGPEVRPGPGSELANRLLHGKPQTQEPPPSYTEYNNMNNSQNGNNQLTTGSEALFDEIDNSQFEFNILDNNPNESQNSQAFNLDNGESTNNVGGGQNFDSWKLSSNTSEVRNTMLRKLATAIESNQLTSPGEASRIAQDIEAKAFAAANCESDYQMGIAHHLAQIFSQSKSGPDSESPDSTTWQEPPSGQPAHSSPDSSGGKTTEGPHFPSDTTLNCFQVLKGLSTKCNFKLSL